MRVPSYRKHSSGQARCTIGGKDYLLGKYGSPESKERYGRLIAELAASGGLESFSKEPAARTVNEILLAYIRHAREYYGRESSEFGNLQRAARALKRLYGSLPASKFGPLELRALRQWYLDDGNHARPTINVQIRRTLRMFRWAVGQGMIPADNLHALQCVEPLKKGRCEARETSPVQPVSAETVEATLPYLTPVLQDMVRFQQLTGCRPGELVRICPGMVDRSGEVWTIELAEHKTAYRGKQRTIYCGPKAQAVLSKYLLRPATHTCFSPQESEKQRRQAAHEARRTRMSCGNRPGSNRVSRKPRREPGTAYDSHSYMKAIGYACDRAFPAPKEVKADPVKLREWRKRHRWSPNQLRHAAATEIRKLYGLEAAQVVLGHAQANVTQVYAERDQSKAIEVARMIG